MWGKSVAAGLLGLPMTVGVMGLLTLLWPGPLRANALALLICAFPVWVAALALPFQLRSAARAWIVMTAITALCFAAIHGLKFIGWVRIA
ncbi:hypothetical protein CS062_24820 [Roseateles chitinivorans]|uniref:Uncharacterized protein n=1 Tax=Roseateles chitinivorans TaxID=2917965 RepID=A0A2G9C270_9BURK|nr:hypothetical protein [Roseateles chitinivorans]PIM50475.1 hypothetical protein CS062_24820 [Roseateles chitinivorans]